MECHPGPSLSSGDGAATGSWVPMDRDELLARLARTRSRGQVKALGAEAKADPALDRALRELARERGVDVEGSSGKALVRRILNRATAARVRSNPIHRDEAFTCRWCGAAVDPGGAMVRDHCPLCLRSLHVDVVPGDRAADCGGILQPVAFERTGDQVGIRYRCQRCGHQHRVRAHPDDQVPPSLDLAQLPGRGTHRDQGRARTLPRRVLAQVRRHHLWQPGDRVLVAVSGGLDSTVLLELLWRTREAHGADLLVCSLDHGLRPESSQEVQAVARHAERLDLPFHTRVLELEPGPGLYHRSRIARRQALLALGAHRIATAHHQGDQAETVLQRLAAGSGASGLAAIRLLDPPWCRPLLDEPRSVLQAWAEGEGLRWMEDPSNPLSERGRMRALLAGLGELRAGAEAGLARSARLLGRDDAFLERATDQIWHEVTRPGGLDLAALRALDPAIQLRCLRRLCEIARADQLEQWLEGEPAEGWTLELGQGRALVVRAGVLGLEE